MTEKVKQIIKQDEHEIYFCNAVTGKINKQPVRLLMGFVVIALFFLTFKTGVENHTITIWNGGIILFLILLLFLLFLIYGLIYNFLLRNKKIHDNEYIITDKRIIIYNSKTDKLLICDIDRINYAMVVREKVNEDGVYGDLTLHVQPKKINLNTICTLIFKPNPDINNANNIALEGIKNPREVLNLITKYNSHIIGSDDRPTFLGKKY